MSNEYMKKLSKQVNLSNRKQ